MNKNNLMNRRRFLNLASLAGAGALLAACTPAATPAAAPAATTAPEAPAEPAEPAAPAAEPTLQTAQIGDYDPETVNFWTPGGSAAYCANFNTISKDFMAKNPDIKVGIAQCGAGDQNFLEVFLARVAAGNPPDASIIWDSPVSLAARGALEPLDDLMKTSQYSGIEQWPAGVLASCQWQGKTYGLPTAAGTYAMYYNAGLFEKKGISAKREDFPKTWADLRKLSKEFTVWDGDTLKSTGFVPTVIDNVEMNVFSALNGSQFYDAAANKFTIDSEQNIEMMQFFLDWINEEYKGDINLINTSANWAFYADGNGRPPEFQNGTMAMQSSGFWVGGDLYGSEVKPEAENWNVASYPVGPSGSGTKSGYWPNWMVIPKGAKKREQGFKYMDYMSAVGIVAWFNVVPDMPTNKNVDVSTLYPKVVSEKRGEAFAKDVMKFFFDQLNVATPMWTSPVQNFANDQITRMVEQVYTKKAAPKDALAEAQKACQTELEKVMKA
jgi:ABC-type glycerol-3-phosphate transport system substrate-binding protein